MTKSNSLLKVFFQSFEQNRIMQEYNKIEWLETSSRIQKHEVHRVLDTHVERAFINENKMHGQKYLLEYKSMVDIAQDIHVEGAYLVQDLIHDERKLIMIKNLRRPPSSKEKKQLHGKGL